MSEEIPKRRRRSMDQNYIDGRCVWIDNLLKEREVLYDDLLQGNHDFPNEAARKERKAHFEHGIATLKKGKMFLLKLWDYVKTHPDKIKLEAIHEMTFLKILEMRWKDQSEEKSITLDIRCVDDSCSVKEFAVGMWKGTEEVSLIQKVETAQEVLFKLREEHPLPAEFTHLLKKWYIKDSA